MAKDTLAEFESETITPTVKQAALVEAGDAAPSTATTARVAVGDTFTGRIGVVGDRDWIAITLEAGQTYVFTAYGSGGSVGIRDTELYLRDGSGNLLVFNDDVDPQYGNYFSMVSYTATVSGTYYVEVRGHGSNTGQYTVRTATDVFTIEQTASQLTDMGWGIAPAPIRFGITADGSLSVNLTALNATSREVARMALETWTAYTGIRFTETNSNLAAIVFTQPSGITAFAGPNNVNTSTGIYTSATVNISASWLTNFGSTYGSYGYLTYLHEIGHALGLGHGGFYDGNALYGWDNHYRNDSYQMTIMSYFDLATNTFINGTDFYPITPMAADIYAIQYLYGTSTSVFAGNTVWGANSNIGGRLGTAMSVMFDGASRPTWMDPWQEFGFTIADSGGIDTMDFSRTSAPQLIDMRPGGISNVYGRIGTVVVALGTVIENAIGGSGADTIYGNDANNFIQARDGNDSVFGGAGNDIVYAAGGNDFVDGGDGNDEIWGGLGDDTLLGGNGNDTIGGAGGNDSIEGGAGRDQLWAGAGRDTVYGGTEADQIGGGAGNDTLFGGDGNDTVFGGGDQDLIYGDAGDDFIWAGPGNDTVYGGTGNDSIASGGGSDTIFGGAGADAFVFYRNYGDTRIEDFNPAEGDRLHLARWMWESQVGVLTPEEIENRFGGLDANGNVTLDFGWGNTRIVLVGYTDLEALDQYITIIS